MVHGCDYFMKRGPSYPADESKTGLKDGKDEGYEENPRQGGLADGLAAAHGNGKGIHTQAEGKEQQFQPTHSVRFTD